MQLRHIVSVLGLLLAATFVQAGIITDGVRSTGESVLYNVHVHAATPPAGPFDASLVHIYGTNTTLGVGDIMPEAAIVVDGASNVDKHMVFASEGVPEWSWTMYRDEDGEFIYLYDIDGLSQSLVVSEGGRVGVNKPSNIPDEHSMYLGTGIDDMRLAGAYTNTRIRTYNIVIAATGTPDTWKYRTSSDYGTTWGSYSAPANCTTGYVALADGITMHFSATTGHTTADSWTFYGLPQLPPATLAVFPTKFNHVYTTTNNVNMSSFTYGAAVVNNDTNTLGSRQVLRDTSAYIYVGRRTPFNSVAFQFATPAIGATIVTEYMNPAGTWTALSSVNNALLDGTANFTQNGAFTFEKRTFSWTKTNAVPGKTAEKHNQYWLRFRTSSTPSTVPIVDTIAPNGDRRFEVYATQFSVVPSFYVDAAGKTYARKAFRVATDSAYEETEYITEERLQRGLSQFYSEIKYLAPGTLINTIPPPFTNSVTFATATTNLIGRYVSTTPLGTAKITRGSTFDFDVFASKSLSLVARPASLIAQMFWVNAGVTNVLMTSAASSMPASLSTFNFPFQFRFVTDAMVATNGNLGISLYAWNQTANSQTFRAYGGTGRVSTLSYPALNIANVQITQEDLDAADAAIYSNMLKSAYLAPGGSPKQYLSRGSLTNKWVTQKYYADYSGPVTQNVYNIQAFGWRPYTRTYTRFVGVSMARLATATCTVDIIEWATNVVSHTTNGTFVITTNSINSTTFTDATVASNKWAGWKYRQRGAGFTNTAWTLQWTGEE